ncbi:MAG: DUF3037 domain-containing protein [Methylococcaceae bacterium]|nr:DUF3037 domain-containing protein [Methylococcaceae bacterium]
MNKQICKYSIIRFQPYPETEEFANIGIVLYATTSKQLEFRLLESKQHARITGFFDPICKAVFVQTTKIIRAEIERIKQLLTLTTGTDVDLYGELIRRREDIIRFSENRVLFSLDPVATVDKLFEHYVYRSFIHEPGHEDKMKKQVRGLLDRCNLSEKYKEGTIGEPAKYEVKFPFVSNISKRKIIKPIHFKHEQPSQLIDHGLEWLAKIQQLEKYTFIKPDEVLFAYDAPDNLQSDLFSAFNEIKAQIKNEGVVMADIKNNDDIIRFADV